MEDIVFLLDKIHNLLTFLVIYGIISTTLILTALGKIINDTKQKAQPND